MATEQLKVKITADASQAKAEIGKFKDTIKKTATETESSNARMAASMGKVAAAAGGLIVALKAIKTLINNAIDVAATGDAIKDNAQKVFMNTTAYQEWGYVLKQNGVEMSALKMGMRQFSQQVANGSDALAKYGITATDVDTAFGQAVATIQNMNTETEKIAAATELFGSRALELFPVLNLTNAETQNLMASYRALGGTMSNELIAASDVCTDSITAMKAAWGGLRNVLAQYFLPIITKVVQWITIAIAYVRILLSAILGIKSSFGGGNKKTSLPATTGSVATNTGNTANNLKKAAKHAKELKRTLMGIDELSKLTAQATSTGSTPSGGGGGGGSVGGVGDVGSFDGLISDETLNKIEKFREKIETVKGLLNGSYLIVKGLAEISMGNIVKGWEDLKEGVSKVWNDLKELFPWLGKIEEGWDALKEKWTAFRKEASEKVIEFKAKLVETVKTAWKNLKDWWEKRTGGTRDFIARFVNNVKDAWDKFRNKWWPKRKGGNRNFTASFVNNVKEKWDKFKNWWRGLADGNKYFTVTFGFVDKLKGGWNWLAEKINNVRERFPITKAVLPYIPYLAKGGVLTTPTTAVMGEYAGARTNPEIATPQSLMYETIQRANGDLVSAFATMTRQVIAAIEDKDLSVRIGDEAIARSAQRGNTAYKSRTGKALLTV